MSSIRPPDGLWRVALRLADQRGVGLWLVGGAVRDALLLRRIHDWDFTVERGALSLARATANALGGAYYPLDADRGAGRVILPTEDFGTVTLDFADLRGDDLISDLRLRDFTVNAMALDADGELIDPLGGSVDLAAGHLRATSERAFSDDPVRTLRAVRQAAELGFSIDAQTEQWIRRDAARLAEPSRERVRDELVRLIALPGAALHVRRLDELDVLAHVLPPLAETQGVSQSWPHRFDVWEHSLHMLDALEGVVMACTGSGMPTPALAGPPPEVWADVDARLRRFGLGIAEHLAATETGGRERGVLLKLAALLQKGTTLEPTALPAYEALKLATVNGAKAQGQEHQIGRVREGLEADLILIDLDKPHMTPCFDPVAQVVYCARPEDVCLTMVKGRILYEDGEFLTLDAEACLFDARQRSLKLVRGA